MSFRAEVIDSGRITIPSDIRRDLEIEEGDLLEVAVKKLYVSEVDPELLVKEVPA